MNDDIGDNPYNTGVLGSTAQDIAVQLQSDLSKLESGIVYFLEREMVQRDSAYAWLLVEHLHSLDAMQKLRLFNSLVLSCWDQNPEMKDEFSEDARKRLRRNIQRMLELRNILSHCQSARIDGNELVAIHAPRAGITETRISKVELESFVGNPFLDMFDDLKYLISQLDESSRV